MWKELLSKLKAATMVQKIATAAAMVAVVGTVAVVSVNLTSDEEPVNNQQSTQLEEQLAEATEDVTEAPKVEDSEQIPDSEENQEVAQSTETEKESLLDKLVGLITGNQNQPKEEESDDNQDSDSDSGSQTPSVQNYVVTLLTNGGTDLAQQSVVAGTKISSLPTPYKEDSIFLGWYYDAEGKMPVGSEDVVSRNLSLYAGYVEQAGLEAIEQKTFASAENVASDFSITVVTEDKTLDAATVLAGIEATNLTDPEQTNLINVSGSNGTFIITGNNYFLYNWKICLENG